jgi:hypothetical protein
MQRNEKTATQQENCNAATKATKNLLTQQETHQQCIKNKRTKKNNAMTGTHILAHLANMPELRPGKRAKASVLT